VHEPLQSLSFTAVHPDGQQPSPLMQVVIGVPPLHAPLEHIVFTTHALEDLHAAPLFPGAATHESVASLHWET
jgi:hypothetical protein